MNVKLKPISHPALGGINIDDIRFTIGRVMDYFSTYKDEAVSQLSRRHARIFQDNGEVYIIDLGSLNGTQVNGQPVEEEAIRLLNGDEINLAGDFLFRVEIEVDDENERSIVSQPPPRLTLAPTNTDSGIDPIVITRLPFLVTRSYTLFGQYMDHSMDDVCKISRPHAIIGQKENEIYIEDLDSENGTFLAEELLDAGQIVVAEGAKITFGSDLFSYKVVLEQFEQTQFDAAHAQTADGRESSDDADSQTVINPSRSFLDMIYVETNDNNEPDSDFNRQEALSLKRGEELESGKREEVKHYPGSSQAQVKRSGRNYKIIGAWVGIYALAFLTIVTFQMQDAEKPNVRENLENGITNVIVSNDSEYTERLLSVHK